MAFGIGDTIASMKVKIGADITEFQKTAKRLERSTKPIAQGLKSVGKGLSTYVTLPLVALGGASLKTAADMEQLKNGLAAVLGDAQKAEKEFQALEKAAQLPGLGLEQAVRGSLQLQAVGFEAEFAREALSEFGNALAVSGGTPDDLQEVIRQLSQIESLGKITAENFNVIRERVPLVGRAMQNAFGTTSIEAIRAADVSTQEFIRKLVEGLREVPRAEGGLTNAFVNIRQAAVKALAAIGKAINESFDIEGLVTDFTNTVGRITEAFNNLSPATRKAILVGAGLAAALGPVLLALGGIASALPIITAGFGALTGPIGLTIAAVGALAAAIYSDFGGIRSFTVKTFEAIGRVVGDAFQNIRDLADAFSAAFSGDWKDFGESLHVIFERSFDRIIETAKTFADELRKQLNSARKAFLEESKNVAERGIFDGFKEGMEDSRRQLNTLRLAVLDFRQGLLRGPSGGTGGFSLFPDLGEGGFLSRSQAAFNGLVSGLKDVGAEATTTSEDFKKLSEDTKKVLSDLGSSIDLVAAKAKVFGTSAFEEANEKAGLVRDAISDLLKEGLEPSSRTIQRMVGEMESLRAAAVSAMAAVVGLRKLQGKGPQEVGRDTETTFTLNADTGEFERSVRRVNKDLTVTADQLRTVDSLSLGSVTSSIDGVSTATLQTNAMLSRLGDTIRNIASTIPDRLGNAIGDLTYDLLTFGNGLSSAEEKLQRLGFQDQLSRLREQFREGTISAERYRLEVEVIKERQDQFESSINGVTSAFKSFGNAVKNIMAGVIADIAAAIAKALILKGIMAVVNPASGAGGFLSSVFGIGSSFSGAGAGITPPFSMSTFSPQVSPVALSSHQPFRVEITPKATVLPSGDVRFSYDQGVVNKGRGY